MISYLHPLDRMSPDILPGRRTLFFELRLEFRPGGMDGAETTILSIHQSTSQLSVKPTTLFHPLNQSTSF
jgi:hypothetical protein